ncbi:50S ribosomal protein L24e [Candidatus Woesearchaeota archaeon]|nr:50S ribosomal protein L24e [Candidatus Woesearchaeota archaeon]
MEKCSFCNQELKPGTGKMYVKKDGKILYFCSRKCEKNLLTLKRKPANIKWVIKKKKTAESKKKNVGGNK